MSYNSKYTGQQVEALLDIVSQGGGTGGEGGEVQKTTEAEILAMGFTKNEGTITEVKMNGASKGTSGVVDLGTVITEHQDISGKVDKVTGKQLSTEDFTSEMKDRLSQLNVVAEDINDYIDDIEGDVCIKYTPQTLTDEQNAQARENIGVNASTGRASAINYDLNVKAINHRGYSYESPENTIPAYIMSKHKGFTYVEGDVSFTKDGVAVLLHDATIDRTSNGTGNINNLNYQEVLQYDFGSWFSKEYTGVKIPTFTEWIALCKNLGLHPYIELKSSGGYTQSQITQIVSEVAKCGMKGKVTYISFNETYLGYVKIADPSARLGYLCNPKGGFTSTQISKCKALKTTTNEVFIDARHMEGYLDVTDTQVDLCINAEVPLEIWSVNSKDVIINMPKYVSGVTSDYLIAGQVLYENSLIYKPPMSSWVSTNSVTLDKSVLTFANKSPLTLVATLDPTNASDPVVWKSSNTSIATVNNGIVTPIADGNCNITATSDGKVATCSVTIEFAKYTITSNLVGCTLSSVPDTIVVGDSFTSVIIPDEGYSLKNSTMSITMGDTDITSSAYDNGIITIANVIGNIVINIICVEVPVYTITRNLTGCTSNNTISVIGEGNPYNEIFTAIDGYDLNRGTVTVTMGGVDITSSYSDGVLTIAEVTGNIVINVNAYKLQTYTITRNLVGCVSNNDMNTILEGSNYVETITPLDGYIMTNAAVSIMMGEEDITASAYNNGIINIPEVNDSIIINIEAFEIPTIAPAEWEIMRTLTSDDILYGYGSASVAGDNTIPFTQVNAARAGYYVHDIPVEFGYRYKVEFNSPVSTANIGVQCANQNWVNAYTNRDTSYSNASNDILDSGWQLSGYEFDLPELHNNAALKAMRLTFRMGSANPNINVGDVTSVVISRRPVDSVIPFVDLNLESIVDGKLANNGSGGSAYDATLNTTSTSDTYSIVNGTLQLKNHAYAEIPYGFNSSTPFTIVLKGKMNTKSSKKYQRIMRTNIDAPSLYYSTNSTGYNVKLAGVQEEGATVYNSLGDFRGSNSLCIDYGNSSKITEESNLQEFKWISDGITIKFYYNGILLASQNASALSSSTSIGLGDNDTSTSYYATLITVSEFKIYNQALSV